MGSFSDGFQKSAASDAQKLAEDAQKQRVASSRLRDLKAHVEEDANLLADHGIHVLLAEEDFAQLHVFLNDDVVAVVDYLDGRSYVLSDVNRIGHSGASFTDQASVAAALGSFIQAKIKK